MGFPFGKSFTYQFFPLADEVALTSLPSQTPAIYVFDDSGRPGYAEASAGTGAVQTVTSWTANGHNGYDITIAAIDDPDPDSTLARRTYWIAINFILASSEQSQCLIRALEMERVTAHHKRITVTSSDLQAFWPAINSYCTLVELDGMLDLSRAVIREDLRNKGFEWATLYRPDRLYHACVYKALDLACLSQLQQQGDKFDKLHEQFSRFFEQIMAGLKIEIDANLDGSPDGKASPGGWSFLAR